MGRESERHMTATRTTTPLATSASLPQRLLDLLFPPRCAHCGVAGEILCAACWADIHEPRAPRCARCDRSLSASQTTPYCPVCVASLRETGRPALGRIVVAADYEGPVGSAIRALKFRRQRRLALPLALLLADAMRRTGTTVDVIIPMPLHAARRRERGYNQAELLARPLAHTLGVPLRHDLLARIRATQPQTRLSRRDRQANVAGAFALASPAAAQALAGKRVALVDDVTTTGATLEAAAQALSAAHPATICALAVARPVRATLVQADDDVALDR